MSVSVEKQEQNRYYYMEHDELKEYAVELRNTFVGACRWSRHGSEPSRDFFKYWTCTSVVLKSIFRWFDKSGFGYLTVDHIQMILHSARR